jgi:hypothetical protein
MLKFNQDEFDLNLSITRHYCEQQLQNTDLPVAEVLRSFNPEYKGKKICGFNRFQWPGNPKIFAEAKWNVDPLESIKEFSYNDLFEKQIACKKGVIQFFDHTTEFKGKILVAEIDSVICDGVSEDESDGFIDYNDCPPIDTWFYMTENGDSRRVLYAWIPELYVHLVNEAIAVNALSVIIWLDDYIAEGRDLK